MGLIRLQQLPSQEPRERRASVHLLQRKKDPPRNLNNNNGKEVALFVEKERRSKWTDTFDGSWCLDIRLGHGGHVIASCRGINVIKAIGDRLKLLLAKSQPSVNRSKSEHSPHHPYHGSQKTSPTGVLWFRRGKAFCGNRRPVAQVGPGTH